MHLLLYFICFVLKLRYLNILKIKKVSSFKQKMFGVKKIFTIVNLIIILLYGVLENTAPLTASTEIKKLQA